MIRVSRRGFLKAGGGLALGFRLPALAQASSLEVNAWVVVQPSDTVVIRYARAELGQGTMSAAAQLVAEELECDWRRVRVEYADSNEQLRRKRVWGPMVSARSRAIRDSHEVLRTAGATAREMLMAAAARAWGVARAECRVANGVVVHAPTGRRTSYGRLAAAAAKLEVPRNVPLKPPSSWKLSVERVDVPDIVTGHLRYAADVQLPGMVHAAIAHSPVLGGRVASVDEAAVRNRRGVLRVIALEDCVAVVADNGWRASQALAALPVVWEGGGNERLSSERIQRYLRQGFEADAPSSVVKRLGEPEAAIAEAERVFEFEYATPFLAHATMEPPGCTAVVKDGQVDVWTSTQDAEAAHAAAAEAAGVPAHHVYLHRMQAGGAFGRRLAQDCTRQAVLIAKAMGGVPVKLLWSRDQDLQHDHYRPASVVKLRAGLDASGYPVGLQCRVATPAVKSLDATAALADHPYWIPHQQVEHVARNTPVPVGFWRGGPHSQNPFARECFLDELAHAGGHDPLAYRLELLPGSAKERAVLIDVARAAGWDKPAPAGVHRGLAVCEACGSYTAAVAELSVRGKKVQLRRIVMAIDPGYIVSPDNVIAQLQGTAAFMLSALFWGEITLREGRVEQSNFHDHRLLRLAEMPPIEVLLAPSGGFWGGVGEAGVPVIAPAVANALFAATGEPVRSLPLKNLGYELA